MSKNNPFRGVGVALITPFTDNNEVDVRGLSRLTDNIIQSGVDFLCVLGTTAETPTLRNEEKELVKQTVRAAAAGRVPLLLGLGGNNTAEVCRQLQEEDFTGFDGILSITPYYNKPSMEGLYQHFLAVSRASHLPIILYNVPGRTGVNMTAETTLRIAADCENVVAIKEASGKMEQIAEIVRRAPEGFEVLSGDDALTKEIIGAGGVGVISVIANALPQLFSRFTHLLLERKAEEAATLGATLQPFYTPLFADGNPAGIKCLLSLTGEIENRLRLPLVTASKETEEALKKLRSIS